MHTHKHTRSHTFIHTYILTHIYTHTHTYRYVANAMVTTKPSPTRVKVLRGVWAGVQVTMFRVC
jgi:hypothetical protein